MIINSESNLFLRDVYSYDISSCHYQILDNLGVDVSDLTNLDKKTRNIKIGLMMRDNPNLNTTIRNITISFIDEYIRINNLSNEDILIRQYDGLITTKKLNNTNLKLPLELRNIFDIFIISFDRKSFISTIGNEIVVKGVSHTYQRMNDIYKKILTINYLNKESIFKGLERIKKNILESNDLLLYCIPDTDDQYSVFLKKYGEITISKNLVSFMESSDIDRKKYFNHYLKPFTQSVVITFL